ncbi:MAG: SRPBCC family protein [Verrucomicrobia bacterium]|nr:SRPBCC family protein [Verrucomicrobiota bacterium]
MLIIEHTEKTKASPQAIWAIWKDVENWNTWDSGLEYSKIDGPFEAGTRGKLRPKGGPEFETLLTCVEPLKKFVDTAKLPLALFVMEHFIQESPDGMTLVTHRVEIQGFLAPFFAIVIGSGIKKNMPSEMRAMIKKAESYESRLEKHHPV